MPTIEEIAVAKVKCLQSTLFFARYFFKEQTGKKFIQGSHHIQIASALDRVFKGECNRLIINIAPRYGKTELAVKIAIARGLALNPKSKFIHLSYSDTLALDNSEGVKEIVKLPQYQVMFPAVQIKKGTDSKQKWYTTQGGGVYATAAGGQVTGFGAGIVDEENTEQNPYTDWLSSIEEFGGAIIIDDPIKPEDAAHEETKLIAVNDRFDTTIQNRVNSRRTPIIIIMQRVHTNDLCGHVTNKYPGWEVLSLPVINSDGTPLWPHKHTIEELNVLRQANEFVFDTQMMQDPRPKFGLLFPKDELNYFKPSDLLEFESSIAYCDVADEGDDFLSMPIGKNIKERIYITDVVFSKENTEITLPLCANLINQNKVSYARVESNSMGAMFARSLQKDTPACSVLTAVSTTNKHTRILMAAGFIKKFCYFVHKDHQTKEYKAFMDQLSSYLKEGKSKHDDAADSLSGLTIFIERMLSHYYQ